MRSFIIAFKEFLYWQTIRQTNPKFVYMAGKYQVVLYFSDEYIIRQGGEVIIC